MSQADEHDAWSEMTLLRLLTVLIVRYGSRTAAARAVGVQPSTLGRWINDGTLPDVPQCQRIAQALDMPAVVVVAIAHRLEIDRPPTTVDMFDDIVAGDPVLLPEAKEHLRAQYRLLRRVAAEAADPLTS